MDLGNNHVRSPALAESRYRRATLSRFYLGRAGRQRTNAVSERRLPTLLRQNIAFADNPDWSDCYCSAYHFTNNRGKAESRREASSLIEEDRIHGFLAYDGGKPV